MMEWKKIIDAALVPAIVLVALVAIVNSAYFFEESYLVTIGEILLAMFAMPICALAGYAAVRKHGLDGRSAAFAGMFTGLAAGAVDLLLILVLFYAHVIPRTNMMTQMRESMINGFPRTGGAQALNWSQLEEEYRYQMLLMSLMFAVPLAVGRVVGGAVFGLAGYYVGRVKPKQ